MPVSPGLQRFAFILALLVLTGCATFVAVQNVDALFGPAQPKELVASTAPTAIDYERQVRPIIERRCLACHGCYDSPCQVKLESYQGLLRGANRTPIYDATRLSPAPLTRLFEDAQSTGDWRALGFHPVLNEHGNTPQANLQAGLVARLLDLKQQHPLPPGKLLGPEFDLSLDHGGQCPRIEEFDQYAAATPQWGMPYALPGLSAAEHRTLKTWLADGAPIAPEKPLSPSLMKETELWESLFNQDSLKHQLAARYIYEHLYLAHIYFEDAGQQTVYFKLVRSRTPPGQPIDRIATRRPYDDPGAARVYYRLWRDPSSIVAKTHMPYRLTPERRAHWRQWFIDPDYTVTQLPSYAPETASNPFLTFQAIPYTSRQRFMLDEAQYTVMNFIKGPVCRGSVALNVIQDRFWVFFTKSDDDVAEKFSGFLAQQGQHLRLPAEAESGLWSITHWRSYAQAQTAYLQAKGQLIRQNLTLLDNESLNLVWDGDGSNPNAALTVFRHHDSATVVQGLVGEPPPTAWLVDYPILERIHYLLVAGFDVYGTPSHQAMTRMYMDFLRMEAEMNFFVFLPEAARQKEVDHAYRGAHDSVQAYLDAYFEHGPVPTPLHYHSDQPKLELYGALRSRLAKVLSHRYDIDQSGLPAASIAALQKLNRVQGIAAAILPETVLIKVKGHGLLSLVSNSAYSNISSMFGEDSRRLKDEDTLTIGNGVLGAYPNVFWQVTPAEIPELVRRIQTLQNEDDYAQLVDRFGIRRTDKRFWAVSDQVLDQYRRAEPISAGVLDYGRYDNR
jgi:hypothetical protein